MKYVWLLLVKDVALLRQILTGNQNPDALSQLALGLVSLKFSRRHEAEADDYSVTYLCNTDYNAAGAAGFFEKIQSAGEGSRPPEFLSTHPSNDTRIANLTEWSPLAKAEARKFGVATFQ